MEKQVKRLPYRKVGFSFEVKRPKERKRAVVWILDVTASAVHHQMNLGSSDPEWKAIFGEPPTVPALGPNVPVCDRSDVLYDASPDRYERRANSDPRVLYCNDLVRQATKGMPPIVGVYLCFAYPTRGHYLPSLYGYEMDEDAWFDFAKRGVNLGLWKKKDSKNVARWLRRQENRVKQRLRELLDAEDSRKAISEARQKRAESTTNPVSRAS